MNIAVTQEKYLMYKTAKGGKSGFIKAEEDALQALRDKCGNTTVIFVSVCFYESPDTSAARTYPLYFHIESEDPEKARISTLEACSFITDKLHITEDNIEIIYAGGNGNSYNGADSKNYNGTTINYNKTTGINYANYNINHPEMLISIPPVVFGGGPTPFIHALNFDLARQLAELVENIQTYSYEQDHFVRLVNTKNSTAGGSFVIPLQHKELLYMNSSLIAELAKKPRPDCLILPQPVPQAAQWYTEILRQFESQHNRQEQILKLMFESGWQVPPCIRKLLRAESDKNTALETCRIITQFFAWIKASPDEIWHLINFWNRCSNNFRYSQLLPVVTFSLENPAFEGCEYSLLKRFCSAEKCFMTELINQYKVPNLFR